MLGNGDNSAKLFKIEDGMKTCHVAFLNKSYLKSNFISNIIKKVSNVIELCKVS